MNGRDTERPWVPRKRKQQAVRLALLLLLLAAATASSVSYAQDGGQAHPNETQLPVDPPFTPDGEALETPPAPDLIAPAQAGRTCDSTPTFDWSDVSLAQRYHIQVGDSASFTPPAIDQYTGSSNYTPSSALAAGKYYWRVRARDASRWSSWSGARYFFVDAPTVPTLLSPAHDSRICDAISTLSWAGGPRPTTYRIQISSMYSFPAGSLAIDATTSASSFTPRRTLGRKRWYWRVREEGSCGNSAYSDVRDFIVSACRAPNLRTPDDGAHTCNPIQEFGWSG